ncbi:MAG: ferrichrome ABC transporter substrate-binding protein [Bradyrhizobium sp.]
MTSRQPIGSRLARLPLVVLVTIGMLLSLLHCTDNAYSSAKSDTVVMTMPAEQGSPPDIPEHLSPCHSGHCLSHVAAQNVTGALVPMDQAVRLPASGREQFPAAMAGLPLFKPPRV